MEHVEVVITKGLFLLDSFGYSFFPFSPPGDPPVKPWARVDLADSLSKDSSKLIILKEEAKEEWLQRR